MSQGGRPGGGLLGDMPPMGNRAGQMGPGTGAPRMMDTRGTVSLWFGHNLGGLRHMGHAFKNVGRTLPVF